MHTNRLLVIGSSGSGKSTLVSSYVDEMQRKNKVNFLVVLTKDSAEESPFSARCAVVEELHNENAGAPVNWTGLLRDHKSLFLEVSAFEPHAALDELAAAVLELGSCLVVIDEAHQIVTKDAGMKLLELYTRGRKRGVHVCTICTSIMQRPGFGLNAVVVNEVSALVSFLKTEQREVSKLSEIAPPFRDHLSTLATPRDHGAPEYLVLEFETGRALKVGRTGEVDISERAA